MNRIQDMDEIFREENDRLTREYEQRVASGEDARDRARQAARSKAERERMEAHGCIERGMDEEE